MTPNHTNVKHRNSRAKVKVFLFIGTYFKVQGFPEIVNSIDLVTKNSAKTLHIEDEYGIEPGKPANFIVLNADNEYDVIRKQAAVTHSYRNGKLIAGTKPAETTIHLDTDETVDFER